MPIFISLPYTNLQRFALTVILLFYKVIYFIIIKHYFNIKLIFILFYLTNVKNKIFLSHTSLISN